MKRIHPIIDGSAWSCCAMCLSLVVGVLAYELPNINTTGGKNP